MTASVKAEPMPHGGPAAGQAGLSASLVFFADLLDHLMQGAMVPKVQLERSLGPILGFFLPSLLRQALPQRPDISLLCPEFPLRRPGEGLQSSNIDWLMFDHSAGELLLVELKTSDTSFLRSQWCEYLDVMQRIADEGSAAFLAQDLLKIHGASREKGKYLQLLSRLAQGLRLPPASGSSSLSALIERLAQVRRARLVYLAPRVSRPADWPDQDPDQGWLSFGDLPTALDAASPHADHWPLLHQALQRLDSQGLSERNASARLNRSGPVQAGIALGAEVPALCRQHGAAALVFGWMHWQRLYPAIPPEALLRQRFKWDFAGQVRGNKNPAHWIGGEQLLEMMARKLGG